MKPHAKYQMMWGGEMRPVTQLLHGQKIVHDPMHATVAVLYVGDGFANEGWVIERINPGDVLLIPTNERVNARVWDDA